VTASPHFSEVLQMTPEATDKLQNLAIVLFIGLALPPAIGFGLGFWVTKENADRAVNEAVLTTRATICVGQFTGAPNYQERLKEFTALDYAAKRTFLEKGGWAKMPGEEKASDAVKEACSGKLEALTQK
jgi:hypothetical protein